MSIYIVIFVTFIMSSVTLATSGSIHQGDERFSENSRGRQCAFNPFMSLTALLYDQRRISKFTCGIQSTESYPRETDCLSLTALENRIIPNAELLSVDMLPTVVSWDY